MKFRTAVQKAIKRISQKKVIAIVGTIVVLGCITTVIWFSAAAKEAGDVQTPVDEAVVRNDPTEAPTEEPTQPETEAPTEAITEPVIEPVTEPATEAPTEPEPVPQLINPIYNMIARETAADGEPLDCTFGFNGFIERPENYWNLINNELEGYQTITVSIENGSEIDNTRNISLGFASSMEEWQMLVSDIKAPERWKDSPCAITNLPEFSQYGDEYFKENILVIVFATIDLDISKKENQLCIDVGTRVRRPAYGIGWADVEASDIHCALIEISREQMMGIDTISCHAYALN